MRIYVAALILMMGAIYLGGCRSTRSLRKVIAAPAVHPDTTGKAAREAEEPVRDLHADSMAFIRTAIEGIERNHIDFTTFSGVMRVHYQGSNGANNEVNAMVRIKKDSIIWIEIYAHAGPMTIKAFQVLVTPDSVKILDRIKKVARLRSVSYLQEQVNLPVDFGTIQDILIGNPIFLDTANILYYRTEKKGYTLFSVGRLFSNFLTLNPDNTLNHSKLDDTDPMRARTCDITYGDYDFAGPRPFSTYRKISVAEKGKVDIEIGINKRYKFNEVLSYPFSVPKNYKRR
ncbi:MAG TPA: DUF4292 domain-containing protein [Puia sp.]|nr:DUF4292 domain-containing protein [Puia sp.]